MIKLQKNKKNIFPGFTWKTFEEIKTFLYIVYFWNMV